MSQAGKNELIILVETLANCNENEEENGQIDSDAREKIIDCSNDLKESLESSFIEDADELFKNFGDDINKVTEDQSCASIQDVLKLVISSSKTPLFNTLREFCQQLRHQLPQEAGDKLFSSVIDHLKSKNQEERYKSLMIAMAKIEESCTIPQSDNSMTSYKV